MSEPHQKNKNGIGKKWLRFAALPDVIWAPLTAGGLMLMVGIIGLLAHQPWLFPSLSPTAFLQVETPEQ